MKLFKSSPLNSVHTRLKLQLTENLSFVGSFLISMIFSTWWPETLISPFEIPTTSLPAVNFVYCLTSTWRSERDYKTELYKAGSFTGLYRPQNLNSLYIPNTNWKSLQQKGWLQLLQPQVPPGSGVLIQNTSFAALWPVGTSTTASSWSYFSGGTSRSLISSTSSLRVSFTLLAHWRLFWSWRILVI